jgi:hypothetical protein
VLIAAWSRTPKVTAIHVFAFFVGMLMTYYIYSMKLFGFFPTYYFFRWGLIAFVSPLAAYIIWFGRGEGWIAALCSALTIGLLTSQGYGFLDAIAGVHILTCLQVLSGFDFLFAIILYVVLPKKMYQHFKVLPLVLVITYVYLHIKHYEILSYYSV